jgi:hypothetical protein
MLKLPSIRAACYPVLLLHDTVRSHQQQQQQQVQKTKFTPSTVSIAFNLALLHEKQGHHEAASEIYKVM